MSESCFKFTISLKYRAAACLQPKYFHRSLGLAIFDIILDVGTDLLIVGIPIRLLWSLRIQPRQKFILGVFLSLNLFMAITACIRVSGLRFRGTFDEVWLFIWQQIEACVAISMMSLTAFRSSFVGSESSRARREAAKRPWYSSAVLRNRAHRRNDEEAKQGLPTIPSATLTGMRTVIQGGRHASTGHQLISSNSTFEGDIDDKPIHSRDGKLF